jgi:mutator family transposase
VAAMMGEAKADVLAFTAFPKAHWQTIWSNNPIERLNKEIKRRADVVEIFPNPAAFLRLATAVVIEAHDEWQVARFTSPMSPWTNYGWSLQMSLARGMGPPWRVIEDARRVPLGQADRVECVGGRTVLR